MQTSYYLTIETRGVIRRIPIQEEDPDMQGVLDALTRIYRIANRISDESNINPEALIYVIKQIDSIYIDYVETYEGGLQMIEQHIPLADTSECIKTLIEIVPC